MRDTRLGKRLTRGRLLGERGELGLLLGEDILERQLPKVGHGSELREELDRLLIMKQTERRRRVDKCWKFAMKFMAGQFLPFKIPHHEIAEDGG